ncbi:MAG: phosphatase PAP2 family protein [Gemmataceae bacterium]|nr:phosphatase PAP2 family protein [Gemmataceae bacterium]
MSTPATRPDAPPRQPPSPPTEERSLKRALFQALGLGALTFAALGLYLIVLKWRGADGKDNLTWTEWDELFPFRPTWVWVYLIPYIIGPALIGLLSRATFAWFVPRALAIMFLSVLVFAIYPTQTRPRPALSDALASGATRTLYAWMVEIDEPPANAAPSLHVSLTCLLALALLRDFPRWWLPVCGGTLVVWLATLYTRQHHLIDVLTGALLACVVVLAWPARRPRIEPGA